MNWPPVKAWTSKSNIEGQSHFVAINYFEDRGDRWVILISVIDGELLIKVSWSELQDNCKWEHGWHEKEAINYFDKKSNHIRLKIDSYIQLSSDSGLTIPISKKNIRPWFNYK